ncbi:MAG: cation transporter [Lachnospiraceae bacterium]
MEKIMNNTPNKSGTFEAQQKLMLFKIMGELPNLICLAVAALVSQSMLVWMDLIDAVNLLLSTTLVYIFSVKLQKNLSYQYNYGTGKLEAVVSLCCDMLLFVSLVIATVFAVNDFIYPKQPSQLIIWVVLLKLVNVLFDVYVLIEQKKNQMNSSLYHAELGANVKVLLSDGSLFVILIVTYFLRDARWAWYISPIFTLGLVVLLGYSTGLRTRKVVIELMDMTCDEKTQHSIIKVLVSLYDQYDEFFEVKSRTNGDSLLVDVYLRFLPETTFAQIGQFVNTASKKLRNLNPNIVLNVVIREE